MVINTKYLFYVWCSNPAAGKNKNDFFAIRNFLIYGIYLFFGKYRVVITENKKTKHIGCYETLDEAILARLEVL